MMMIKILVLTTALFVSVYGDVPKVIADAFKARYADVSVKWEHEPESKVYEGKFKKNGMEFAAVYRPNGTFVGEEHDITVTELPQAIKDKLPNVKIKECEVFVLADGKMVYEVEGKKEGKEFEGFFNLDGTPATDPEK